jgi:outer membrane protein assembly factor BamE (lipoprotein component of BamABCDE complex)
MKTANNFLMVVLAVVAFGGCAFASTGKKMDPAKISQVKVGVTTKQELIAWFGKPQYESTSSDGTSMASWAHVDAAYVMFAGESHSESLAVTFDSNGVVRTFRTGKSGNNIKAL